MNPTQPPTPGPSIPPSDAARPDELSAAAGASAAGAAATAPALRRTGHARRVLGLGALAILTAFYCAYRYYTSDAYIREQAIRFLTALTGGEVHIDRARFSLFGGITLMNVRLLTPGEGADGGQQREIFSASQVELSHDPWALMAGRLRVDAVTASAPLFTFVYDAESDRYNWDRLFAGRGGALERTSTRARLKLRSAQVRLVRHEGGERTELPPYTLDADAWPHPQQASAYEIDYRIYNDAPHRIRGVFDPALGRVRDTPYVRYGTLRQLVPSVYRRFLDQFGLRGRIRLRWLDYAGLSGSRRGLRLELDDASCRLPIPLPFAAAASQVSVDRPPQAALELQRTTGEIRLVGDRVEFKLNGELNGAESRIHGAIDGIDGDLTQAGFDITLSASNLVIPEGDVRRALETDESVPFGVREFMHDFQPHGRVNGEMRARRIRGGALELVGDIVPLDAGFSFHLFPYRLDSLRGAIRFRADGIHLEELTGRHGTARVRLDGRIHNLFWWTDSDLLIHGEDVEIDDDLERALPPRFSAFVRRLGLRGRGRTEVRLARRGGTPQRAAEWTTSVVADLEDARAKFDRFPYALEHVAGRITVGGGRLQFENIAARHGTAGIKLSGHVLLPEDADPTVELSIEAAGLPIDDDLRAALSESARRTLVDYQLGGLADLSGRIFVAPPATDARCDLDVRLRDGRLCVRQLPFPLDGVEARLRVTSDWVDILKLQARHQTARVSASGRVDQTDSGGGHVSVRIRDLKLSAEHRAALPPDGRDWWDALSPRGVLDGEFEMSEGGRAAPTGATTAGASAAPDVRGAWRLRDGALKLAAFPVQIDQVAARLTIDATRVQIHELTGAARFAPPRPLPSRTGTPAPAQSARPPAAVRVSGDWQRGVSPPRLSLSVSAKNIPLESPTLHDALPARLRGPFARCRPGGLCDVELGELVFEQDPKGASRWSTRATATLRDATADLGAEFRGASGKISATLGGAGGGLNRFDADVNLTRVAAAGWPLRNTNARLAWRDHDDTLRVNRIAAQLYGGLLEGFATVQLAQPRTPYGLSLTVADADLGELVNDHRRPRDPPATAAGRIYANLALHGLGGPRPTREGRGEIQFRDARLARLPALLPLMADLKRKPDEGAFNEGVIEYYLVNDRLKLNKVDLRGQSLSMVGAGTLELATLQLNLRLLAGAPTRIEVPLLTELLDGAARELVQVHVSGTLGDPKFRTEPLGSVQRALDELFGGGGRN